MGNNILVVRPKKRSGIYAIINPITKKAYVGESVDLYRRFAQHIRGVYGWGDNSNRRLSNEVEERKAFVMLPILFAPFYKASTATKDWLVYETVVMYMFRKNGWTLYNGDENNKDNTGKNRDFLIESSINVSELHKKTCDYLNELTKNEDENIWKERIMAIEPSFKNKYNDDNYLWEHILDVLTKRLTEEFNKDISDVIGKGLNLSNLSIAFDKISLHEWGKYINEIHSEENVIYRVSKSNARKISNELATVRLSAKDLEDCGLTAITKEELIALKKKGLLDRIIVSKFGHYLDQSPMTILSTKNYDIEKNKLTDLSILDVESREDRGCCFWSLKRLNLENTRDFLMEEDNKKSKFAILAYTPSMVYKTSKIYMEKKELVEDANINLNLDETLDMFFDRMKAVKDSELAKDIFVYGYAFDESARKKKNSTLRSKYPETMFPAVVSKTEKNNALLISELRYAHVKNGDMKELYKLYNSHIVNGGTRPLNETLAGSTSHACAEITKDSDNMFESWLSANELENVEEVSFLLAKLEYPYIVPLINYDIDIEE